MEDHPKQQDSKANINEKQEITCSVCQRILEPGDTYIQSVITNEITCSRCDKGKVVSVDTVFSVDS